MVVNAPIHLNTPLTLGFLREKIFVSFFSGTKILGRERVSYTIIQNSENQPKHPPALLHFRARKKVARPLVNTRHSAILVNMNTISAFPSKHAQHPIKSILSAVTRRTTRYELASNTKKNYYANN
jgi:hypothetical protein